jgi:peptidoglycan hydrolase-like protein with peptidoglycan-binding domain
MISRSDLAAIFHQLAHEIEKVDAPPAPAPDPPPAPPPPASPAPSAAPPPPTPAAPAQPKPVINLDTIKGIQQAFNQIRAPNYAKLEENGEYGPVMAWALKEFQATAGIPVTGEADKPTIDTLHKIIFGAAKT